MKPDFDYTTVPYGFIHCLNKQCQHTSNCLRHQVALRAPVDCSTFTVLNPTFVSSSTEKCSYFLLDQLQTFALGMTHLLENLSYRTALTLKRQMVDYLHRATYYRCWRKERLITPNEQQYIRELFINQGITTDPVYDEYVEQYEWKMKEQ